MTHSKWPKRPPKLTTAQQDAREKFMLKWHQVLPQRYAFIENFNQRYPADLPIEAGSKTLEIGAGIGEHLKYENMAIQDYYCLEYREEFCKELRNLIDPKRVMQGDIQERQPWSDGAFDRVVAIHVLEHLVNLPCALREIVRLLKPDGVFDIVLPTEGTFAYTLARRVSAQRLFESSFGMDYLPIVKNEHVNTLDEVMEELGLFFDITKSRYFPLAIPIKELNLVVGFRLRKKKR